MKIKLRDGSGWRKYRYLIEDMDRHGNVRIYFRRKGQPKLRLTATPGTPEFDEQYKLAWRGELVVLPALVAARVPAAAGTMRWLCEQYYGSAAFQALGLSTRKARRGILDAICERAGQFQFATLEPRHVAKLRDEKASAPAAANARVKAIRQLFAWASSPEYRHATWNPAREVAYLKSNNPDGFRAWSKDDVIRYQARHPIGTKARLALDLLLYTGVRRSDVVKLGPQMERDGKLIFNETKGRGHSVKTHELPIFDPLRQSIAATKTGHLVYLVTEFGRPHSVKAFGNWFKRRCREAEIADDLSAHGLRKFGAQLAAELGATEHQIMALYGWDSAKTAAIYTRKANRARLEASAAQLLAKGSTENESVPLFPVVASNGTIRRKRS